MLIFTLNGSHSLSKMTMQSLGGKIVRSNISSYSNAEYYASFEQNSTKIVVILNHSANVNDDILKLLCMLDVLNAKQIEPTIIMPLMPYSRQDKRENSKSFGLKIFASMINNYQIKEIITFDLHNIASASLFNARLRNITPDILFDNLIEYDPTDIVISTDQGGKARANKMADTLGLDAFYPKKNRSQDGITHSIDFNVKDKNIIIVDDIIDGGSTIKSLINLLQKKGAQSVSIVATHIIFYNKIIHLLKSDFINKVYTSTDCNILHHKIMTASSKF